MSFVESGGAGARTIKLLMRIAETGPEFNLSDIAEDLGLPVSTIHRLLGVLVEAGLVERTGNREYCTGVGLYGLGLQIVGNYDLARLVRPVMKDLAARWEETIATSVYNPKTNTAMILETVDGKNPLRFTMSPFEEFDMVWGPKGWSILAYLPPDEVERALTDMQPGPHSGRDPRPREEILDILAEVRAEGHAKHIDPINLDFAGFAAPIFGPGRRVLGSIGVIIPAHRRDPSQDGALIASVMAAGERVSRRLAGAAPVRRDEQTPPTPRLRPSMDADRTARRATEAPEARRMKR